MVGRDAGIRSNRQVFNFKSGFQAADILAAGTDHSGEVPWMDPDAKGVMPAVMLDKGGDGQAIENTTIDTFPKGGMIGSGQNGAGGGQSVIGL